MSKSKRFLFLGSISMLLLAGFLFTSNFKVPIAHAAYSEPCPPSQSNGSNNSWVQVIQFRLNNLNDEGGISKKTYGNPFPLSTDGSFGSLTEEGVKDFQASNSLTANGTVGNSTWAAMGFCTASVSIRYLLCCAGPTTHCPATIGQGNAGPFVQALQQGLNIDANNGTNIKKSYGGVNWFPLSLDGIFGSSTKAAVQSLQLYAKITQDGTVGSQTWGAFGMCYF